MTQQQKEQIAKLRTEGYSILAISEALGISKDTIKTHCRRYGLNSATVVDKNKKVEDGCFCRNCGTPLVQTEGKRVKLFCSDKCRTAWWNTHPEQLSPSAMVEVRCMCCGTTFRSFPSRHRSYCSRQCYIRARYGGKCHE